MKSFGNQVNENTIDCHVYHTPPTSGGNSKKKPCSLAHHALLFIWDERLPDMMKNEKSKGTFGLKKVCSIHKIYNKQKNIVYTL